MADRATGVRLAGRGGQGVMLAGFLLGEAAMTDGLNVVQTQSYGPEARLGAAKTDVILSTGEIDYPEVVAPDVFLCLSHDAFVAYSHTVARDALRVIDSHAASGLDVGDAIVLPLADTARGCGAALATNIVGLGALIAIAGLVSEKSLREALAARVAPGSLEVNTRAFAAGLALPVRARSEAVPAR